MHGGMVNAYVPILLHYPPPILLANYDGELMYRYGIYQVTYLFAYFASNHEMPTRWEKNY
jgi:hypothetical protein